VATTMRFELTRGGHGVELAYWQIRRGDALHKCKRHLGSNLPIGKYNQVDQTSSDDVLTGDLDTAVAKVEEMPCINARDI
jgi:hypothetical protein